MTDRRLYFEVTGDYIDENDFKSDYSFCDDDEDSEKDDDDEDIQQK